MRSRSQLGRSPGEVVFALIVFAALGGLLYFLLRPKPQDTATPQRQKRYKCWTNPDGTIPVKAVVVPKNGAVVYSSANGSSETLKRLPMFESYFPRREQSGFIEVSDDPMSDQAVGWVRKREVLLWTTRECLKPNRENPERKPMRLWPRFVDIGRGKPIFEEDLEADPPRPYPVLDRKGRSYEIGMTWQSADYSDSGVGVAWTDPVDVPDDARFYYLTTRPELQRNLEEMNAALIDLASGKHAENPIVQLLKGTVQVTAGNRIDEGEENVGILQKILNDLRNPLKIANMRSAEIRAKSSNMKQRLDRLQRFSMNRDNFNSRGIAWIPAELLPGS